MLELHKINQLKYYLAQNEQTTEMPDNEFQITTGKMGRMIPLILIDLKEQIKLLRKDIQTLHGVPEPPPPPRDFINSQQQLAEYQDSDVVNVRILLTNRDCTKEIVRVLTFSDYKLLGSICKEFAKGFSQPYPYFSVDIVGS